MTVCVFVYFAYDFDRVLFVFVKIICVFVLEGGGEGISDVTRLIFFFVPEFLVI